MNNTLQGLKKLSSIYYIKQAQKSLARFQPSNILVIGDVMLDHYHMGNVNRVSPEAPIPLLLVEKEEKKLGGAAFTAQSLVQLGCKVSLCSVIGNDQISKTLSLLLDQNTINQDLVIVDNDFKTPLKARFIAKSQQILRVDYENAFQPSIVTIDKVLKKLLPAIKSFDAITISDYAKGFLQPAILKAVIQEAKKFDIPCICDPGRGIDFKHYFGVHVIKPNRFETEAMVGFKLDSLQDILKASDILQKKVQADFLTISLDSAGIFLYKDSKNFELFPSVAKEVFDVSGAGDMVISILSAFLAKRESIFDVIPLANVAAGIIVTKIGTYSISLSELQQNVIPLDYKKIISLDELVKIKDSEENSLWVFTSEAFEDISAAQIKFWREMENFGDFKVIAIDGSNASANKKEAILKLKPSILASLASSISSVDWVIILDTDVATAIKKLKPQYVVKKSRAISISEAEKIAIKKIGTKLIYLSDTKKDFLRKP